MKQALTMEQKLELVKIAADLAKCEHGRLVSDAVKTAFMGNPIKPEPIADVFIRIYQFLLEEISSDSPQ